MERAKHRIEKNYSQSLRNWEKIKNPTTKEMTPNSFSEMGWGRLVFAHTFNANDKIVETMCSHGDICRDIAMYVIDPHVIISMAHDKLFIDPSHTYRLWNYDYRYDNQKQNIAFSINRLSNEDEAEQVNAIYAKCHMKGADPQFLLDKHANKLRTYFIAKRRSDDQVIGIVTGIDHVEAFNDPEGGSSLWSLAVDPQAGIPSVGISLVRQIAAHYFTKARVFMDVSVMHNNEHAISLYKKLGFQRIPVFCIKRKNTINESLYIPENKDLNQLNPYARLIVDEAKRRGIVTDAVDADYGLFKLSLGSRSITCRESLSEMTTAVAMTKCDDKSLTRKLVEKAGVTVPRQTKHVGHESDLEFLEKVKRVVVKPARGEQGSGISVDISNPDELKAAVKKAESVCSVVLIEEYIPGEDLRIIVIDHKVIAAAVRKPPSITGTGSHTISDLIHKHNRRRMSATGGESRIPDDDETLRCLRKEGYNYDSILEKGKTITVRKTANLHTGGTIHDVTDELSDALIAASVIVSKTLDIPVTGLDFIVPDIHLNAYAFIEANERPGLANHEPQPTAERFIDLLFPESVS
ncbi:MAG: N-acetylglutaminylglutamine synthetase [Desulfobacula sp.]|uniref:N-acetylglutaminylglutamine synthetase n=1 Tax=Desulfobacula sp. TaxID=2593537 RepID=UPI001D5665F7|nr:N-acetylglutaminylglutamine synthetase [Desulfobacula sp.]MBT3805031.1 N-acetylglutaminylglutamine synthetase [Desulfobacula sp.]MBT4024115.1 N-acetylglutaminylglutamine synthetase [Desulfobacula sp.]MBT4197439.1 N-acetylglutaminylglutamine synthetase [Desulfobacula sp.]MBT4505710.1 N-acetylglutaminylglutamine synthetase [Desulfobacula sp.]